MLQRLQNLRALFIALCRGEYGAFSLTNKQFVTADFSPIPAVHAESELTLISSAVTGTTVNTGIVGLKWMRVRARLKTLGGQAATESVTLTVQAGTGAAITAPCNILQITRVMTTGDTEIMMDGTGWSEAGFQSYAITILSSGSARTPVFDVMVDCA